MQINARPNEMPHSCAKPILPLMYAIGFSFDGGNDDSHADFQRCRRSNPLEVGIAMKARDVMTLHVITVGPEMNVRAVANTLVKNRISAVPVVEIDCRLVGIVSEGDLMRRVEAGTESRRSWWRDLFTPSNTLAAEFAKSHAQKAKDVMTRNVITASPGTGLRVIANLLEKHRIKRIPIVENDRLVGIVSREVIVDPHRPMRGF